MFDIIIEYAKKIIQSRLLPIAFVYIMLTAILVSRLFQLQIISGEEYEQKAEYKEEKILELKSTRGNIYDRNGKLLAYNEVSYTVTLEDIGKLKTNEEKNSMIYKLIKIIEKNGGVIAPEFEIQLNKQGELEFTVQGNSELRLKKDVYSHRRVDELTDEERSATAVQVFNYLRFGKSKNQPMFGISETYSLEDTLKIMAIRYTLFVNSYYKYLPITVANNVDKIIVAEIKENSANLPGVDILTETHRVYTNNISMSHILGYTGLINQDELVIYNEEKPEETNVNMDKIGNYSQTDKIGKAGVEKELEEYLRGTKGYEMVAINDSRRVVDVKERIEPVAGNDIYLTIDSVLQEDLYNLLEKKITEILVGVIHPGVGNGSKGTSSEHITISIYDVYFALLDNNIIDLSHFTTKDATELEKQVYEKFRIKQEAVYRQLEQILSVTSDMTSLSEEYEEYLEYIYQLLKTKKILISQNINYSDTMYLQYASGKISLSKYLQYAISNDWVDLTKLELGDGLYSTSEIYEKLLSYITKTLKLDSQFNKQLYASLIYSYELTGREICLLLFDQNVLKYNEEEVTKLKNGYTSAYSFLVNKIKERKITPAQLALNPCSGAIVITDIKTGDVIAAVSYPAYDNNKMANKIDSEYWAQVLQDKSYPMLNRVTQKKTAPGSTFKMISSIAALEEGVVSTTDTIRDEGSFSKISPPAKCWIHPGSHGYVNIPSALEVSCNYFYYEVAYRMSLDGFGNYVAKMGLDKLEKYTTMFGFDSVSGIELPMEYEPQISTEDPVRSAIGQGNSNFTPSQLSRYVTAIANRGKVYNLTILDKVTDMNKKVILDNKATLYNEIKINDSYWDLVQQGMYQVCNGKASSTTRIFDELKINIAAKTGTAQENDFIPDHALLVSYGPYEKPEISVTCVISSGYTSGNVTELGKEIYKCYYKQMGVDITKEEPGKNEGSKSAEEDNN